MSVSVLTSLLHVTGSQVLFAPNLTGIGGAQVSVSGQTVFISGGASSAPNSGTSVQITGSAILTTANFSGIGGTIVLYSGNQVLISGGAGGGGTVTQGQLNALSGFATGMSGALQQQIALSSAGVISLNGLSGNLTIVGTGGISAQAIGQIVYISGQNWATSGDISLLSGWTTAQIALTGQTLYSIDAGMSGAFNTKINSSSGYAEGIYVHRTGDEFISGVKTFVNITSGLSGFDVARDGAYYQDSKLALRVFNRTLAPLAKHIMIGSDSPIVSGLANTFIGVPVGRDGLSAVSYTIAIGDPDTLSRLRTGSENTVIGDTSFTFLQIGSQNTTIGGSSCTRASGSYANIALGNYTLSVLETGSNNIAIGRLAGGVLTSSGAFLIPSGLVTGSNNILIGHDITTTGLCSDNFLNIADSIFGSNIYPTGKNSSLIGINNRNPQASLHIFAATASPQRQMAITVSGVGNARLDFESLNSTNQESQLLLRSARLDVSGNAANTLQGNTLGTIIFGGNVSSGTTNYNNAANISAIATSDYIGVGGASLVFKTADPISSPAQERMRITDSGSVGIGTTNPTGALHVNGAVCLSGIATSTTANVGAATLPVNPVGFVIINITGSNFKVPYYNV